MIFFIKLTFCNPTVLSTKLYEFISVVICKYELYYVMFISCFTFLCFRKYLKGQEQFYGL